MTVQVTAEVIKGINSLDALRQVSMSLLKQRDRLFAKNEDKNARISAYSRTIDDLKLEKQCVENRAAALEQIINTESNEPDILKRRIEELETENRELHEGMEASINRFEPQRAEIGIVCDLGKEELSHLQNQLEECKIKLASEQSRIVSFQDALRELNPDAIKAALIDKDQQIDNLKVLAQRYAKSDQRKQQQIDDLQMEISGFLARLNETHPTDTASSLEEKVRTLQEQHHDTEPNRDLVKRNKKLKKIVEKSNQMYAQLLEENRILQQRTQSHTGCYEMCEFDSLDIPLIKNQREEPPEIKEAYLRKVLTNFFYQDTITQRTFIPLLFELVGCNEEQIEDICRQWDKSHGILSTGRQLLGI